MKNYLFNNAVKFFIGDDAVFNLPFEMAKAGCTRPLIICDETAYRLGNVSLIKDSFRGTNIQIIKIFYKIEGIAKEKDCEKIVRLYKTLNCDSIIVIGKKGAIAAAKCAKIMLYEDIPYVSHYKFDQVGNYAVRNFPLYVIPTNLGSGIEASNKIRIYSEERIYEFDSVYASTEVVFVDSRMTDILPPRAVASAGLFVYSAAMTCYAIKEELPMVCLAYAQTALELANKYLEKSVKNNADKYYSTKLMEGVVIAGAAMAMLPSNPIELISNIICDRYKANFQNVYAILFRHLIKNLEVGDYFGYALSHIMEAQEYALYTKELRAQKVKSEIEEVFKHMDGIVDYYSDLSSLKVKEEDIESIANNVLKIYSEEEISMSREELINLLNKAYKNE